MLHQTRLAHLETLVERTRAADSDHGLPRFVERGPRRHLECGVLGSGSSDSTISVSLLLGHPTGPPRPAPARTRERLDFA